MKDMILHWRAHLLTFNKDTGLDTCSEQKLQGHRRPSGLCGAWRGRWGTQVQPQWGDYTPLQARIAHTFEP